MQRRAFYVLMGLLLAGTTLRCTPAPEEALPNLLFIITDDQRFDMMGNITPMIHTPVMDALAEAGVRFENAFVTTSICAASRASMLSGTVERTHRYTFGTPPYHRDLVETSYPTMLRRAGYRTGHIGKFGVNLHEESADTLFSHFEPLNRNPYFKPQDDGAERHLTDITADRAIDFLYASAGEPFALTLSFNAPHAEDTDERQYIWPEATDHLYQDVAIPDPPLSEPEFFAALPPFLQDENIMNRFRWYWRFDQPEKAVEMTKGYLRMISGVDAAIGRVLEELETMGLRENTVVIMMGDNGYFLGERGYAGKWLPHEPSIRVPLLIHDPRHPEWAGNRPVGFALNIDIAPTLLDLAGLAIPDAMQGESLLPLLDASTPAGWRTDIFVEHLMEHIQIVKHEGIRNQRYKYARYFEQDPVFEELYDLETDPLETNNLATNPDAANLLAEMRARTDELRDAYGGVYVPHGESTPFEDVAPK